MKSTHFFSRVKTHDQNSLLAIVTRQAVKYSTTYSRTSAIIFWKHKIKTVEKINRKYMVIRYTFHTKSTQNYPRDEKFTIWPIWAPSWIDLKIPITKLHPGSHHK